MEKFDFVELGKVIAAERKKRAWTQADLARVLRDTFRIKASKSTISRIETGNVFKIRKIGVLVEKITNIMEPASDYVHNQMNSSIPKIKQCVLEFKAEKPKKSFFRRLLSWRVW